MHVAAFRNRSPRFAKALQTLPKHTFVTRLCDICPHPCSQAANHCFRDPFLLRTSGHSAHARFPQNERVDLRHLACGSDGLGLDLGHVAFLLIASLQTLAIAVIGKCVEKIYFETNARPPISWKKKSASFRPCLRAKMCAIAQRQRRFREMAIRV